MIDQVTTHQAEEDSRNETVLIYVDGQIVPKADAKVSVFDSGFMLGDGVWEGLRFYNGRWAFIDEHLDRLFAVAKAIDLFRVKPMDKSKRRFLKPKKPTIWSVTPMQG